MNIVQEFPIVALGGSAGAMAPIEELLNTLDPKIGMGFIVIMHLGFNDESHLTEILSRWTSMAVPEAVEGIVIEKNCVYVMLPGHNLTVVDGVLRTRVRTAPPGHHKPIDHFLHSLATNSENEAVAIIFSGGDGDGSEGCKSIKARGGQIFVQDPRSAKQESMPETALEKGCVDFVGTPKELADELARFAARAQLARPSLH